ncbi:MAG: hypothetical protein EBZ61_10235 [Micrococcales bacterium]|nr:hypothetical protein [Micrococcales bacterium]
MNLTRQKNKSKQRMVSHFMRVMTSDHSIQGNGLEIRTRQSGRQVIQNLIWAVNASWYSAVKQWENLHESDPDYGRLFEILDELKCLTKSKQGGIK